MHAVSDQPLSPRRRSGLAALVVGGLLVSGAAAACSPTSTETTTTSTTSAPTTAASGTTGTSAPTAGGSTYASIDALHQGVVDGGFTCTLEYPGLHDDATDNEVSICTIEDETAYLTIWGDPANLAAFAASPDGSTGTVALGANWTITVSTPDLASRLASALGGSAPGA
jgi:hypothetical protein